MKRIIHSALAATVVLSVTACGSDGPTELGPQIELTQAQTADMFDALDAISFEAGLKIASASIRNRNVALYSYPVDESETCPNGGSTRYQGTVSGADNGSSMAANVTQSYTNCASQSSSGVVWTFNGAPNIKINMSGTINLSTGSYSANGTMVGALNASSSMGSGSCSINLTITETGNDSGYSFSVTGTVCGQPYSESESDTF
jgi:predicted small lipoprotein YifL